MNGYHIVTVEQRHSAVVRSTVAFADLPSAQRSARAKIAEAMRQLAIEPSGDRFTLCRMPHEGRIPLEPGVIVSMPIVATGDVIPSELPAGRAVHFRLIGPYEQLPQAWPALFGWCGREGLKLEGRFWEVYDRQDADPRDQQTQLFALLE